MPDLSVLIAAREERWLSETVADVLKNRRGDTDVLVLCDGSDPIHPLPQHDSLRVVIRPSAIGQRAAINELARLSDARYVMKLDAHCAVSPGFDVELVETGDYLGPDITQIPRQYALHVFDWRCVACGVRTFQGKEPASCPCGSTGPFEQVIVWDAIRRCREVWGFGADLKFRYTSALGQLARNHFEIKETMSCLGACWMLQRDRFLQWGGLDEDHGSWGQMGTEIGCKSWLSGGRMVTNTRAWFSHLFQTDNFGGPPYPRTGEEEECAREHSRSVWLGNAWPQQVHPLRWMIERFGPVPPGWNKKQVEALAPSLARTRAVTKGVVYYTHGIGDPAILETCRAQIARAAGSLPIVSVSLESLAFGRNVVLPLDAGRVTMFRQILAGLEALDTDVAFLVEHDVLYHPSHFDFTPTRDDLFYYNQHTWRVDAATGRALFIFINQVSELCADRQLLIRHYRAHLGKIDRNGGVYDPKYNHEPGNNRWSRRLLPGATASSWMSAGANVDIKSESCLTRGRWRKQDWNPKATRGWTERDDVPGWGVTKERMPAFLRDVLAREVAA